MRDFGVILAAHGDLAAALLGSLEMLTGPQQGFETVALRYGMGREELLDALQQAAARLSGYPKLLILTDLVGGTPSNMALHLVAQGSRVQLISGVNMALLCEVAVTDTLSTQTLADLVDCGRLGLSDEGARLRACPSTDTTCDDTDL